jgi:ElaB/YqjD/DUF883 family membrane-anchored ribosome-binding protein
MTNENPFAETSQNFAADLAALRDDITKLSSSVTELVRGQASATSDTVFGAVDSARQKLSETASDAKDRLTGAGSDLEATIERNPLIAVLIAMAAGLLIGLMSRARK